MKPKTVCSDSIKMRSKISFYLNRLVVLVTLIALLISTTGCTSLIKVETEDFSDIDSGVKKSNRAVTGINSVVLKSGKTIKFKKPGASIESGSDKIVGVTQKGYQKGSSVNADLTEISLDSVQYITFQKKSSNNSSLYIIGAVVLVVGIVLAVQALEEIDSGNYGL